MTLTVRKPVVTSFRASAPLRETVLIGAALWLVISTGPFAANWDRFRGPNGAGQSDDAGIPTTWEPANFLWMKPLPGVGHSSPVVWDKRLFITSADPKTGEQIVSAFDAITGTPLWEKRFEADSYHMNSLNSYASSTPALDAERLYLLWLQSGRIQLVALTHDGNEVWRRDIGPFEEVHGFGKSPIVVGGLVYVANDNHAESSIVAVDSKTGQVRWQVPRDPGTTAFATPCLLDPTAKDKTLLTVSTASGLTAFQASTGKIQWQGAKDVLTERCVSSPIVASGMVLVSCGQGGNGKVLVALRPGDTSHPPQEVYRLQQNIPNVPTPIVAGDLLFLWHDRGVVSCYDLATGHRNWRQRVGGDYHSSPIRVGNRIFGISMNGEVVVLAADRQYQSLARNELNEPCHATPAVADGRLYVRTESSLLCVGDPNRKN
ncbi:MAG TPA: PQQ-binding-like beta-propeller repeat protein [Lacipirellulaceae bacterium]|nr:PQQ-binding-like beta-propeller repeat protein [Lacipirellulaceae bacterium]